MENESIIKNRFSWEVIPVKTVVNQKGNFVIKWEMFYVLTCVVL